MSWWSSALFRLTNAGWWAFKASYTQSSCWPSRSVFIAQPATSSKSNSPFIFHRTENLTFWNIGKTKILISVIKITYTNPLSTPSYNSTPTTGIVFGVCQHLFANIHTSFSLAIGQFMINFSTASVLKSELVNFLIVLAFWRTRFCWQCMSVCAWLSFQVFSYLPQQRVSLTLVSLPGLCYLHWNVGTSSATVTGFSTSMISFATPLKSVILPWVA